MVSINKVHKTPVKWSDIKLLMLDCDGVFTDGRIIYAGTDLELKNFDAHDGMGFMIMRYSDIKAAVITGRTSAVLERRCRDLKIEHLYQGVAHKLSVGTKLLQELNLTWGNVAYIGDDWNDVPVMRKSALSLVKMFPEDGDRFLITTGTTLYSLKYNSAI